MVETAEVLETGSRRWIAGHLAPAGVYRDIETRREIFLRDGDVLPASLDGRVACYELVGPSWSQVEATCAAPTLSPGPMTDGHVDVTRAVARRRS